MPTFVVHPEEGGPFPIVLYLMDAPGIRPALMDMASRLAATGYYVMLPWLYYRDEPLRELGQSDEEMHRRRDLMQALTRQRVVADARVMLAHAAADPAARPGAIGAIGFCMSGPYAVAVANALPERVAAAASIHGAWFVTDRPDSSHLNVGAVKGELYFAWAADDSTAPPADLETMRSALDGAGVRYRIEPYQARHGFAPPGHQHHDRVASERHWERVLALLARNL